MAAVACPSNYGFRHATDLRFRGQAFKLSVLLLAEKYVTLVLLDVLCVKLEGQR